MVPRTFKYGVALACGVLAVASLTAAADQGDKAGLSGTWGKKDGELKIEFIDKQVLKIVPHGDSALIAIVCDYTVEKGGLVKAKVTGLEGKEEVKEVKNEVRELKQEVKELKHEQNGSGSNGTNGTPPAPPPANGGAKP